MFQELSTPPDPAVELERAILPDFETISKQRDQQVVLNTPIARDKMLIIAKMSKLEWDK